MTEEWKPTINQINGVISSSCEFIKDEAYDLLEEIYGDMCCSDADYEDRPYYEIIEEKNWCIYKQAFFNYLR